ncbi:MAG: hypothetical protein V1709_05445, partial [Planctomycetota bacterium]
MNITTEQVKNFLLQIQGKEISLNELRKELDIPIGDKAFNGIRNIMFQLSEQKVVRPVGNHNGVYKVVKPVLPVKIFSVKREIRPPFELIFPKNFEGKQEMDFSEFVTVREGDLILISGLSNFGKTALCMNFCGENINKNPILMGNEYTTPDEQPTPRFLNRLNSMDWVEWCDQDGNDKFT